MTDAADPSTAFDRYRSLLRDVLAMPSSFDDDLESNSAIRVERGLMLVDALHSGWSPTLGDRVDRLLRAPTDSDLAAIRIIDRAGHRRPAYVGLLVYCWALAYRKMNERLPPADRARWEESLRAWCDLLERQLASTPLPDGDIAADLGGVATAAAWRALALSVAGKLLHRDAWCDLADDTFGRIARSQQPTGELLRASARDNPETHWFDELVILHALASYAVHTKDESAAAAVHRATAFHIRETQPDHATNEPWALLAFIWNPDTRSFADQILHTASTLHAQSPSGVASMLLADALYCLELLG